MVGGSKKYSVCDALEIVQELACVVANVSAILYCVELFHALILLMRFLFHLFFETKYFRFTIAAVSCRCSREQQES